jgi:hypothetical protein
MLKQEIQLGDLIDDYCTRCHLLMNHYVVSMVDGGVRKVRCQTCRHEHDYRHCKGGHKKKTALQELFDQVAASLPQVTTPPKTRLPQRGKK